MLFYLSGFILFIVGFYLLILITQYIWNMTMPDVFGLKELTTMQTLGLLVLVHIFFGSHCTNVITLSKGST